MDGSKSDEIETVEVFLEHIDAGRNYFVTADEGRDARVWAALEVRGLAEGTPYNLAPRCRLYRVTAAGRAALTAARAA